MLLCRDGKLDLDWRPRPGRPWSDHPPSRLVSGRFRRGLDALHRPRSDPIPPPGEHEHWPDVEVRLETSEICDDFEKFEDRPGARQSEWRVLTIGEASLEAALAEFMKPSGGKPAPETSHKSRIGRPPKPPDIEPAFYKLESDGEIDFGKPMARVYPLIRRKITGSEELSEGLGDEAIRVVISPLFNARKIPRKPARKIPKRP
jgi:hypothetical protein